MNSELDLLAIKIERLVHLTQELRQENHTLRTESTRLSVQNEDLLNRIVHTQKRITTLLEKIPLTEEDQEST